MVVYDVSCPHCSRIARELPECVTVRVKVRSCKDPQLPAIYPNLPAGVAGCREPAIGVLRIDGQVRWWKGLSGAIGLLPVLRPRALPRAIALLRTATSVRR
ncbi:hypothetical protein GCM10009836_05530 [Pseudonocardia ailaonensis]|uniref:DUF393 domain-containing protein n=1 Tax=Pseudonocardia ailaonensis TaxID=367279 RepID=A0ABN2MLC5_9PSEU